MSHSAAAFFYFIVGSPGAGKSSQIEWVLRNARAPRSLIFDIEHEYSRHGRVLTTTEGVRQALINSRGGPVAIVYQPPDMTNLRERFDVICRLAFAAQDLVFVVDELADVDSPNPYEVPEAWKLCLRRGRKRRIRFVCGTQRPADVNKRLRTFATRLRVGMLADPDDQVALAKALGVTPQEVGALMPLEWIERDRTRGLIERGRIAWQRGAPVNLARTPQKNSPSDGGGGGGRIEGVRNEVVSGAAPGARGKVPPHASLSKDTDHEESRNHRGRSSGDVRRRGPVPAKGHGGPGAR